MATGSFQSVQRVLVGHDVYVFRVDCNCDATVVAAATSEADVGVVDLSTLRVVSRLQGHTDALEDVHFFQSSPSCLASCSQDGTARLWDLRESAAGGAARTFHLPGGGEACSVSVGRGDSALACGAGEKVHLLDVGSGKPLATYRDCHTDTVTHVRFHPASTSRLLSGSLDGLVVMLDTDHSREDQAMLGVVPNEECVQSFTLVGPDRGTLCTVSTTDQVRIWSVSEDDLGSRRAEFLGIRDHPLLAREDSPGHVVQSFYDESSQQVFLLAGSGEDEVAGRSLTLFRVGQHSTEPAATFASSPGCPGHDGIVRSAVVLPGGAILTAGEDGAICAWRQGAGPSLDAPGCEEAACPGAVDGVRLEPSAYGVRRGAAGAGRAAPY